MASQALPAKQSSPGKDLSESMTLGDLALREFGASGNLGSCTCPVSCSLGNPYSGIGLQPSLALCTKSGASLEYAKVQCRGHARLSENAR